MYVRRFMIQLALGANPVLYLLGGGCGQKSIFISREWLFTALNAAACSPSGSRGHPLMPAPRRNYLPALNYSHTRAFSTRLYIIEENFCFRRGWEARERAKLSQRISTAEVGGLPRALLVFAPRAQNEWAVCIVYKWKEETSSLSILLVCVRGQK